MTKGLELENPFLIANLGEDQNLCQIKILIQQLLKKGLVRFRLPLALWQAHCSAPGTENGAPVFRK